jgi:phenylpropionate dioxygenase-like ring-hydroxylating dioxygenase large terminal subunit
MTARWIDNEAAGLGRAWYAVAMAADVGDAPVAVRVLGRDWVLARLAGGLVAFEDRCPHRLAPLSIGTVCGEVLQCRYHGWAFDGEGRCRSIPALGDDGTIPARAAVATPFAVAERYGMVWLAPEEPVVGLPEFPEWDDPAFDRCWNDPRATPAGAFPLTDNFLDATHLPTVHTGTFGVEDGTFLPPHEVERDGWRAWTTYRAPYRNHDDPKVATGEHPLVQEHLLHKEVVAATTALVRLTFPLTGGVLAILFSCLPVDATTSVVFKVMARNDFAGDEARLNASVAFEDRVLDEDLAVLESYRDTRLPLDPRVEVHTRNDRLGLAYRRLLADLVAG